MTPDEERSQRDAPAGTAPFGPAPDLEAAAKAGVLAPALAEQEPHLHRRLRWGVWTRYGRVVLTSNGAPSWDQQLWMAVLRAPGGTVLAAQTAAVGRGLRIARPPHPQVLSPYGSPRADLPGVDARRTRMLGPLDVHPHAQPPQLRLSRAVVDAATLLDRADDVRALLCAPVQQRLLRAGDLRETVLRLGPLRHRRLVLLTLDDVEGGAHSVRELAFRRLCRRAHLPAPTLQVLRRGPFGRYYLDAVFEGWDVHAEVDGLGHLLVAQWSQDCARTNELEIAGTERRLRLPGFWLDDRQALVVDQLTRALRAAGWPG